MKKIYARFCALFLSLMFVPAMFLSQVNSYFLNDPVWTVKTSCKHADNCMKTHYINYYTKGDTLINGFIYKRIYKKSQGLLEVGYTGSQGTPTNCVGTYSFIGTSPSFFVRSQNKKIYLRELNDTSEYLLYDFNLSVGDSLPETKNYIAMINYNVTAIDSIYTPYGYRKRFTLNNGSYLIEGIGHSNGFVEYMGSVFDCGTWLDCFSLKDTAYFPSIGPTCNIAVGIMSYWKSQLASVFPNPFVNVATIRFNSTLTDVQMNIYDYRGQIVREMNGISGEKVEIERGALPAGLYLYELRQNKRAITNGKLMILD